MTNQKPWQPSLHGTEPWLRFAALQVLPAIRRCDPMTSRRRPYNPVDIDNPDWFELTTLELFATTVVDRAARNRRIGDVLGVGEAAAVEAMFAQFCSRTWWAAFGEWDRLADEGITIRRAAYSKVLWEKSFHGNRLGITRADMALECVQEQTKSLCKRSGIARIDGTVGLQIDAINSGMTLTEATELTGLLAL